MEPNTSSTARSCSTVLMRGDEKTMTIVLSHYFIYIYTLLSYSLFGILTET